MNEIRIRKAAALLYHGKTIAETAVIIGVDPQTIYIWKGLDVFQDYVKDVEQEFCRQLATQSSASSNSV